MVDLLVWCDAEHKIAKWEARWYYVTFWCFCCVFQDLFRKVLPQQCLGSVWSRRASSSSRQSGRAGQSPGCSSDETVASVSATVDQFNAVTHRVIASVVDNTPSSSSSSSESSAASAASTSSTPLSTSQRARIVEKWIDVAQVCLIVIGPTRIVLIISLKRGVLFTGPSVNALVCQHISVKSSTVSSGLYLRIRLSFTAALYTRVEKICRLTGGCICRESNCHKVFQSK